MLTSDEKARLASLLADGSVDVRWLRALNEEIWTWHPPASRTATGYRTAKRRITDEEWDLVHTAAPNLICSMTTTNFGFDLGMSVFAVPSDPPYPGVPRDEPEYLTTIAAKHLPWYEEGKDGMWDRAWEAFRPLTHAEGNVARLAECGMPAPRGKGYYEY